MSRVTSLSVLLVILTVPLRAGSTDADSQQQDLCPCPPGVKPPVQPQAAPPRPVVLDRPQMTGSVTGYVENAIVGTQIRFRVDNGFGNRVPDRAEFFYAKCGCYRFLQGDPFDPDAPGPGGPGEVESNLQFQSLFFDAEYALHPRVSVFGEFPFRALRGVELPTLGGFSDLRAGVKYAFHTSENHSLTAQVRNYFPTGDARRGMGTNHYSIEPAVLYFQRLTPQLTLESQFGSWFPVGGSAGVPVNSSDGFAGKVLFYGAGAGYDLTPASQFRVTPVLEFVGWRVLDGFQTAAPADASGTNIANLKIGMRLGGRGPGSFYVSYGIALTDQSWYDDIVRVEYRYVFE